MDWSPVPEIRTARLVLDAPRLTDKAAVISYAGDLSVSRWLVRVPHPYTAADADVFLGDIAPAHACFAVREAAGGPLAGIVGISPVGADGGLLGYWFGPPFWGRGYATEAAAAVVAHAFGTLGLGRLQSGYLAGNVASCRVLEKLGFTVTGTSVKWNVALDAECEHIDMCLAAPFAP
ncbi:GNAT family N-acetyltransferase [Acuticoccus sediminis]|uniref:GNAT family N-acetyltransferase n=1 Tax=Acuticoccus sediminis TaxID=2184697 RepID=UPI001CFE6B56|nr:GNAT family N-acetyltransferase [Acuticoccus sediminis]